jgi:hypothetical protein
LETWFARLVSLLPTALTLKRHFGIIAALHRPNFCVVGLLWSSLAAALCFDCWLYIPPFHKNRNAAIFVGKLGCVTCFPEWG